MFTDNVVSRATVESFFEASDTSPMLGGPPIFSSDTIFRSDKTSIFIEALHPSSLTKSQV